MDQKVCRQVGYADRSHANIMATGAQSGPKSSLVLIAEHGKAANLAWPRDRADITARRVRRDSMERIEKANARA